MFHVSRAYSSSTYIYNAHQATPHTHQVGRYIYKLFKLVHAPSIIKNVQLPRSLPNRFSAAPHRYGATGGVNIHEKPLKKSTTKLYPSTHAIYTENIYSIQTVSIQSSTYIHCGIAARMRVKAKKNYEINDLGMLHRRICYCQRQRFYNIHMQNVRSLKYPHIRLICIIQH